ncbi:MULTISPECIES: SLATT domain-containing protein [unclassified Streptomyces]|uniref:SLATT domain-containing protein n=1 Tax=unclassified Streptomyces TaxID=2593676 RepID=UPI0035DDEAB3
MFIGNIATWGRIDLARVNVACVPLLIALLILCAVVRTKSTIDWLDGPVRDEWEAGHTASKKVDLELAIERKRLSAASINLPTETRRHIYRETVPGAIEQYRSDGLRYRRVHNFFQSIIIVGSLATSTAASLAETPAPYKWITVGTSFSVGLAAGFTGYFKFRERSFYLQQTADTIEEEYDAVNLKVGRYKGIADDETALLEFTERVETLRNDQRKRQQQLDQPTETPEG